VLCFIFRFSIPGIAFYKRGVIFPCLKKQYSFSGNASTRQITVYPVGALLFIFIARFYSFIFPSLLPAIGKNLKVKKCFSFCFEVFFLIA